MASVHLTANTVVQAIAVARTQADPIFSSLGLAGCTPIGESRFYYPFFAGIVAFDIIAFSLAAFTTYKAWREFRTQLTTILLRDSLFWLLFCVCASSANLVKARRALQAIWLSQSLQIYYGTAPERSNPCILAVLSFVAESIAVSDDRDVWTIR